MGIARQCVQAPERARRSLLGGRPSSRCRTICDARDGAIGSLTLRCSVAGDSQAATLTSGAQRPFGDCSRRRDGRCERVGAQRCHEVSGQVGALRGIGPSEAMAPPQPGQMFRERPVRQR